MVNKHSLWLVSTLALLSACAAPIESEGEGEQIDVSEEELCFRRAEFGEALPGLNRAERAQFARGKASFSKTFTPAEGLGPVFNERSCASCHDGAGIGGGSDVLVTRFGKQSDTGFDALSRLGGSVIQVEGIGKISASCEFKGETVPAEANVVAQRLTTPTFGLGLVDAVPDATFRALAAAQPAEVRGRVNEIVNAATGEKRVGKFGWKAQSTSLQSFSSGAFLGEMGITSPDAPREACPNGDCAKLACNPKPELNDDGTHIQNAAAFMRLLAAPQRAAQGPKIAAGERIFQKIGCASCHTATLETGASAIAALDKKSFHPYSDFLIHDMGTLGDGIGGQGQASPTEMRTAPLWGLRARSRFLHDGRADSIEEAILAHDGQGSAAQRAFKALSYQDKYRVMLFLKSL